MKVLKLSDTSLAKVIEEASEVLKGGGITAFPTETYYGLGAKYDDNKALKRLYSMKRRPKARPLPLIIGDKRLLSLVSPSVNPSAERLMDEFWPGPLTLLITARSDMPELITTGTGKVAVRIPGESTALSLVRSLDFPVTSTSANVSGMPPADDPEKVIGYFPDSIDLLIDGGKTPGGLPSTIVDATEDKIRIVRPGVISSQRLSEFI